MQTDPAAAPRLSGRWLAALALAVGIAMWPVLSKEFASGPPPGAAPLDFVVKDMAGRDVRLSDYKGRPLLINFWATWCPPCKAEIPGFVDLVEKYQSQGLTILGVSTDDSPDELEHFAAAYKVNYPLLVGLGHDELLEAYEATFSVPVTWFIRRDGTIYMKKLGTDTPEWFESQVKALF